MGDQKPLVLILPIKTAKTRNKQLHFVENKEHTRGHHRSSRNPVEQPTIATQRIEGNIQSPPAHPPVGTSSSQEGLLPQRKSKQKDSSSLFHHLGHFQSLPLGPLQSLEALSPVGGASWNPHSCVLLGEAGTVSQPLLLAQLMPILELELLLECVLLHSHCPWHPSMPEAQLPLNHPHPIHIHEPVCYSIYTSQSLLHTAP